MSDIQSFNKHPLHFFTSFFVLFFQCRTCYRGTIILLDFDFATSLLLHAGKWRAVFIQLSSTRAGIRYVDRSSGKLQLVAPLIAPEHDSSRIKGTKYSTLLLCANVFQNSDMRLQYLACDKSSGYQFSSDYPGIVEPVQVKISVQLIISPRRRRNNLCEYADALCSCRVHGRRRLKEQPCE